MEYGIACESSFMLKFTRKKANRNDQEYTNKMLRLVLRIFQFYSTSSAKKYRFSYWCYRDTLLLLSLLFDLPREKLGKEIGYMVWMKKKMGRKEMMFLLCVCSIITYILFILLVFPFFCVCQVAICRRLLVV